VFHRFVDFSPSGRNETGSPSGVLSVVATAGNEPLPKGVVKNFWLLLFEDVFGWKINSRND
jgi:hypothetical protein